MEDRPPGDGSRHVSAELNGGALGEETAGTGSSGKLVSAAGVKGGAGRSADGSAGVGDDTEMLEDKTAWLVGPQDGELP